MTRKIPHMLHANGEPQKFCGFIGELSLTAAKSESGSASPRQFHMELYNGGPMRFFWSDVDVYVDLQGMDLVTSRPSPVFKDHNPALIVGHTTNKWIENNSLLIDGVISGAGRIAQEVVDSADNGFPWQASQGTEILATMEIKAGTTYEVNGRVVNGPALIVTKSKLGEASFVPLGADDTTIARMVASQRAGTTITATSNPQTTKENKVDFETWLQAQGFTLADLGENQRKALEAAFKAAHPEPVAKDDDTIGSELKAARAAAAAETRRISEIRTICAGKHGDIEAKAIEEGWSKDRAELEVLRASRSQAPNINANRDHAVSNDVLQVAMLQAAGMIDSRNEDQYDERVLEAADKRFKRRAGLQEVMLEAARANGYGGISVRTDPQGVLRAAFGLNAAGFSHIDMSGIFSNVANKSLLDGFNSVEQAWRMIAATGSVTDFKQITRYRMTGAAQYEKVGPAGEIKSGSLGEMSYTNKADTYGRWLSRSRHDIINDDLGARTAIPRRLGRGSALKLNDVFWTVFLDNNTFFASGNSNYFDGASSALSIDSLTTAEQKFMDQKDADGKPVAVMPRILLVPTALSAKAAQLMASAELRDTTASTKYGVANPHAGKFEVVTSAYLGNSSYTGYSTTAWYMLASPADLAVIEAVFLNGQQSPIIETADADFSTLGVQMRGYHDFGVAKQEYRGGVKSKGAA